MKLSTLSQRSRKPLIAALLAVLTPPVAHAAATPDAGSILQQIKPVMPPVPSSTGTGLIIEQEGSAKLPPTAAFAVKSIQIKGNTLFGTQTLHALVADAEGKTLTLSQLDELAGRITDYYHSHGYPLARAIIPPQTIQNGVVHIEIIEARYGKVKLDNSSRVNESLLEATLGSLQGGQPIGQAEMDRALLLLSDIPGVTVNATLKPGEAAGTSDLLVITAPGPAAAGNVALDDYGNRYTGRARVSGGVSFYNPLHYGDTLSANVLSSGSGMGYERIGYDTLLNGRGARLGGSYSSLNYTLGDTLASLNGHGTAVVSSLWAKQPLKRGRNINLYGQLQYDQMQLRDHIDATGIQTDRSLNNYTASLSGDAQDALLTADAVNTWSVGWTSGQVAFDNSTAQQADAATAKTQGNFSKWNANFSRLQNVSQRNSIYLTLAAQRASGNLDSSQKMSVGGPYTVRAYDMGAVSGDAGSLLTAEFRRDMGQVLQGQCQAVAFVDSAHVTVNQNVWVAGANSATLTGAGVGLNWAGQNQWNARTYVATRLGELPELVASTSSTRAWVEISKGF